MTKWMNVSAWFWSVLLLSKVYSWINIFVGPGIISELSDVHRIRFGVRTWLRLKAGDCTILIDQSLLFDFTNHCPLS